MSLTDGLSKMSKSATSDLSRQKMKLRKSMNWGTFKPVLTDALIYHLQPIQARYEEIMGYLDQVLAEGASKAADIADVTVSSNVYQAMGFLKRR
ncbi:putative tryptophan--tRNA ligase [Helianthus annuus]|nr:putative tryptophan--tRNA ligase [Helianthus annuus]